nr:MAG TPA: minor tail protein [Caudoviricetes sp.]
MAADSVGQIGLDLVLNKNGFDKQMAGIQNLAKKAGKMLAAAFTVKKIVDFGKECIELGSDLAEVQNVVDVVFPRMNKQIDEFAKNAAAQFGLSETMAKKFTGTFGAMSKAFGFGEKQAYDMSTTLTGLAGDVASFYNISQDEAYTKLKSVFTGETESLKDLGVVMTQTALDSYAMANGFGKTTAKMSEMEKVALRYQFVQDQLTAAVGDFSRTSDGWANQVRILKLQFDSLKATIGQGLINVLTPVIKVINTIIGKLMSLANAFKAFTEMFAGKKGSGGASAAASGMEAVTAAADKAGAATSGVGDAAKKTAKELKGVTTGIDELNIIDPETDSGSSGGYSVDSFDMGEVDTFAVDELDNRYQSLIDKAKELQALFKEGFRIGFQNQEGLDMIQRALKGIKKSLIEISTDPAVQEAANSLLDSFALNLGKIAGSCVSVGITIGANLLGGLDNYLQSNAAYIKERIVRIFDAKTEVLNAAGELAADFADVFKVFKESTGQQITANIIEIFSNATLGMQEIVSRKTADTMRAMADIVLKNKGRIKDALQNTLEPLETVTGSLADLITNTFSKISKTYDTYVEPAFDKFSAGWDTVVSGALNAYNQYLAPTLGWIADRFSALVSDYVQPLMDAFVHLWGAATEATAAFWEALSPFVSWFSEVFFAAISNVLTLLWTYIEGAFSLVSTLLTSFMEIAASLIEFLNNVFAGEWEEAWLNIQSIVQTIWNMIQMLITAALNAIRNLIRTILTDIKNIVQVILSGIKTLFEEIWNQIKTMTSSIWNAITEELSTLWELMRATASDKAGQLMNAVVDAWSTLKNKTKEIWDGIWGTIKGSINSIIAGVENMVNRVVDGINKLINSINSLAGPLAKFAGIPTLPTLSHVSLPRLAQGGFVRANTPQLAVIGDNRHQGEIVAPEDKMQAMVDRAVAMASQAGNGGLSEQYLSLMVELLERIISLIEQMDLTVNIDIREIRKKLTELDKRSGYTLRTT